MTNVLVLAGIGISGIILAILSLMLVGIGKQIAKTPDIEELRGTKVRTESDKSSFHSPEKMPKVFVMGFSLIYIFGSGVVLLSNDSVAMTVIGGVSVFAAVLFAATIVFFELSIYQRMQKNVNENGEKYDINVP